MFTILNCSCISQVIDEASNLQREKDQAKFFVGYSSITNSLEERFIELLLLINDKKIDFGSEKRMIDFTRVFDALKDITISKDGLNGKLIL